jgi:hypothetical protein
MNNSIAFLCLYLSVCLFIGLLFYAIFRREVELPTYQIKNGPTSISVGKKYKGIPGMDKSNALPQPTMPKAPAPFIVKTS